VQDNAGDVAVHVNEPGADVTLYDVIAEPPFEIGAVHDTTDVPVAFVEVTAVANTAVGAPGTVAGTAPADATDAGPVPAEFVALTVNVCDTPFARPITVHVTAGDVAVQVFEPGDDVTVYVVIAEPPLDIGAVHDTTDCAFAFDEAVTAVGATGGPTGVTATFSQIDD
jgi:hypothetical protein